MCILPFSLVEVKVLTIPLPVRRRRVVLIPRSAVWATADLLLLVGFRNPSHLDRSVLLRKHEAADDGTMTTSHRFWFNVQGGVKWVSRESNASCPPRFTRRDPARRQCSSSVRLAAPDLGSWPRDARFAPPASVVICGPPWCYALA